ncbi:MAG: hypothetical protein AB7I18_09060 [Candidatus Berkiella sp.]
MLDISLLPRINAFKAEFEQNQKALEGFYSKPLIDKACYEYAQEAIRKSPQIMMASPQALAFYSELANPSRLKAIIFEQEKQRLIKEMPEHRDFLQKFRLSRLKNGYTPGVLCEHIHRKTLMTQKPLPPQTPSQIKRVRFA